MPSFNTVDDPVMRMYPAKQDIQARLDIAGGKTVTDLFHRYCKDESGATAIEYSLCCMILLGALVAILGTGGAVGSLYQTLTAVTGALG